MSHTKVGIELFVNDSPIGGCMKIGDLLAVVALVAAVLFLTVGRSTYDAVYAFSPALVAFVKFALLATFGEALISRVLTGVYLRPGFGLVPKMIIWGFLGMLVYSAFVIFEGGVTVLLFDGVAPEAGFMRVLHALSVSLFMNAIFAPVLMTTHRLTDLFIDTNGGRVPLGKLNPGRLLASVDWGRMWGFVFARTIPLFWIPAHTVTFLMPPEFRLSYAAGLSVALGLFMALVRRPQAPPTAEAI